MVARRLIFGHLIYGVTKLFIGIFRLNKGRFWHDCEQTCTLDQSEQFKRKIDRFSSLLRLSSVDALWKSADYSVLFGALLPASPPLFQKIKY